MHFTQEIVLWRMIKKAMRFCVLKASKETNLIS